MQADFRTLTVRSSPDTANSELDLLGWKREVFDLYRRVRELEPEAAWREWRAGRDRLFATHPQTPLGADALARFEALRFFPYDPAFRVTGRVVATQPAVREVDSSTGERIRFLRPALDVPAAAAAEPAWDRRHRGRAHLRAVTVGAGPVQPIKSAGLVVAGMAAGTPIGLDIAANGMYIREIGGVGTAPDLA